MWTVVFVSQDRNKVDKLVKVLNDNSVMTMIKSTCEDDFEVSVTYEILVPCTELETAQDIIVDIEIK